MKNKKETIQHIRAFNRYYTALIGLLEGHLLDSDYSLAEARILYEVYVGKGISASQIMSILNIDKGYLSRILQKFEKNGLIARDLSVNDARIYFIVLTVKGLKIFHELNDASNDQIDMLIDQLPLSSQQQLVEHMKGIMLILKK